MESPEKSIVFTVQANFKTYNGLPKMNLVNQKTQAAIMAMEVIGAKYVKRTAAHIYFDIPHSWTEVKAGKAAKEFIRQTGIGVKMRFVKA